MVTDPGAPGRNWGGEYAYTARRVLAPRTVDEVSEAVQGSRRVHALGSRHSFNDVADTEGELITLTNLPVTVEIDAPKRLVWVSAGLTYGALAQTLDAEGWALDNLASLPHISVGGAIATGTHGSGTTSLAAAVAGLEIVGADGEMRTVLPDAADFAGSVVALGALGVVVRVALRIEPSYRVAQAAFDEVDFTLVADDPAAAFALGDSVSLFTDWHGERFQQVWVKSREGRQLPATVFGSPEAAEPRHPVRGRPAESCTAQGRQPGPWFERFPHFRMGFTPSTGREIQSEYFVPLTAAGEAIARLRSLGDRFAGALQVSEMRFVRADGLWLSGAFDADVAAFHFTWEPAPDRVLNLAKLVERELAPLGARPHFGKVNACAREDVAAAFPKAGEFAALVRERDPSGRFHNAALERWFGLRGE